MDEYLQYDFTIKACDLLETLKAASDAGHNVFVVINGMNYNVTFSDKKRENEK